MCGEAPLSTNWLDLTFSRTTSHLYYWKACNQLSTALCSSSLRLRGLKLCDDVTTFSENSWIMVNSRDHYYKIIMHIGLKIKVDIYVYDTQKICNFHTNWWRSGCEMCWLGVDSSNPKHTKWQARAAQELPRKKRNVLIITIISFMLGLQQI